MKDQYIQTSSISKELEKDITKVAKGAGITLIGSSIGKGLFFLTQLFLARFLGAEVFGLYVLGFAIVKICEIISSMGLKAGGMRFVAIYNDKDSPRLKGVLISSTVIPVITGIFIGTIILFLAGYISESIFHNPELKKYLNLFAISIPFVSGMSVISSLLLGFHTTKYTVYTREFIQPLSNIFIIFIFYYMGFELSGIIYAFILSHVVAVIAGIYYITKLFPGVINKDIQAIFDLKGLISYSAPLLFIGFLHFFIVWINSLMLGILSSSESVGIYTAAAQLPLIMILFIVATNSIYASVTSNLYNKDQIQRISSLLKATTRWVSYATLPLFIFLVFSAREIMMIFGNEYVALGKYVLIILSFGQLISCLTGGVGVTLTMTGKQKLELLNSIGIVVINITLNLILIPSIGAIGAAISNCISISLINIIRVFEIKKIYKIHPFSRDTTKYLVPSFFAVIFLTLINYGMSIEINYVVSMLIKFLSIVTVFTIYWIFNFKKMNNVDRYIFDKIKNKLQFQLNV